MNKHFYIQNPKRVNNAFWGEGGWCKTHNSFWGDEYPRCTHQKDNKLCVPEIELKKGGEENE